MSRWAVGTSVCVALGDQTVRGQVWAPTDVRNYVWVALDNGRCVAVHITSGTVCERPASAQIGSVAA